MEENSNTLRENVEKLFKQKKFDEITEILTDEVLETFEDADLYIWRGNALYYKKDYSGAISNYSKVIELNPNSELALYNKGTALASLAKFVKAIADFDKVIELNPDSVSAFVSRGSIRRVMEEYDTAIADYNEAIKIDPDNANAYYNRGLTYYIKGLAKKENNVDLKGSKRDFEKYLELTTDKNEVWTKYAKYYIEYLDDVIEYPKLLPIIKLVFDIKEKLLIQEECVTHYTSFSVLKELILEQSKFRISEGNFMNDPSEGKVFFDFLEEKPYSFRKDGSSAETFSPKPFIGSFVTNDKDDDLNMWRFYGKEEGVEAKGCAITLRTQEFIDDIDNILSDEEKEARLDNEREINFYWVVYLESDSTKFYIPSSDFKSQELTKLMLKLKKKVKSSKVMGEPPLEKYLNSIAFLFKSDSYKNENEVRLVVKGIEFDKKYCEENKENMSDNPPRVYIELEPIKKIVSQITLGPRVNKANEWASAFHYSYKGEDKAPIIRISHLPYK